MIYKVFNKVHNFFYQNHIKSKVSFSGKHAKQSFIAETGAKIYNAHVEVGDGVKFYHNVIIFGNGPVIIGDGSKIGYNTIIYASKNGGVYIGKNCAIAANAYIIDTNHSTDRFVTSIQEMDHSQKIVIGDNVWISAQCVIGMGSKLGNNTIIGANSFVNKEFPENAVLAGSPATLIKYRGE